MAYNIPLSSAKVKEVLSAFNLKPNKLLGQNFLVDLGILQKIALSADISKNDTVLEVGPGLGILTQTLAKKAKRVIAVEKDPQIAKILKESVRGLKNIEVVEGDILKFHLRVPQNYKVVANLPYYITSPVIRKFLEAKQKPELMVLMVQKEVAQRICAKPPRMNLLAVSVQFYAEPKIVSYVKKTSFWPQPNVDSAIIRINIRPEQMRGATIFFKLARAGFKQPRKQLGNNLAQGLRLPKEKITQWLLKNNLKPTQRAETLRVEDWKTLTKTFDNSVLK